VTAPQPGGGRPGGGGPARFSAATAPSGLRSGVGLAGALLSGARQPQRPDTAAPAAPERAGRPDEDRLGASPGVRGLETEYGIAAGRLGADAAARELFKPVVAWGRSTNVFTPSGARLYLDVGSHPEYATAECTTLAELLAQDRAGDATMLELAQVAGRRLGQPVALFKNNADSAGHGFGSHENYQVAREGAPALAAGLIPFLVTRQLVAGAGHVQVNAAGARYTLSARADQISEAMSPASTRARPMINTRDEPHADGQFYRRLHIIAGDSNMSQAATRFKIGATALAIAALTRGGGAVRRELAAFELEDPARAVKEVSHGWREAHPIRLKDGRTVRPAAIQRAYLEAARKEVETAEEAAVIGLWNRALDGWETLDFAGLETELDWLAKLRLIEHYRQRTGAALADPRVARLELAYHQLGPDGLRGRLEASGMLTRLLVPWDISRAVLEPPGTTRARLRGRFVAAARAAGREYSVDWVRLKLGEARAISLPDPLDNANEAAERLIARLEREAGAARSGRRESAAARSRAEFDLILERAAAPAEPPGG
jgi:proteasome accessory factor A